MKTESREETEEKKREKKNHLQFESRRSELAIGFAIDSAAQRRNDKKQ